MPLSALVSKVENHSTDDVGVYFSFSVDNFFALLHLLADVVYELGVSRNSVVLQVLPQIHQRKVALVVGQNPRSLLHLLKEINLEVVFERVRLLDVQGTGRENKVPNLNAVVGETVDEVEVEITQEVREFIPNSCNDLKR